MLCKTLFPARHSGISSTRSGRQLQHWQFQQTRPCPRQICQNRCCLSCNYHSSQRVCCTQLGQTSRMGGAGYEVRMQCWDSRVAKSTMERVARRRDKRREGKVELGDVRRMHLQQSSQLIIATAAARAISLRGIGGGDVHRIAVMDERSRLKMTVTSGRQKR
jgi:hypothetical protein